MKGSPHVLKFRVGSQGRGGVFYVGEERSECFSDFGEGAAIEDWKCWNFALGMAGSEGGLRQGDEATVSSSVSCVGVRGAVVDVYIRCGGVSKLAGSPRGEL